MKRLRGSAEELIEEIRRNFPTKESVFLRFESEVFEVATNSAKLATDLRNYFGGFVTRPGPRHLLITVHEAPEREFLFEFTIKQPDPGKTKIKEEFVEFEDGRIVRKRLTGMSFVFSHNSHLAVGPCVANSNQVINFINNRYIQIKLERGCLLGHAAAVMHKSRGLALAGFSGAGKSTLALHMMSKGTSFISNDRLMIHSSESGLTMYGVAKLPRINPGTALNNQDLITVIPKNERAEFESMTTDELWNLEHKYDVFIDKCFGDGRFRISGPMNGLMILNWKRNGEPTVIRRVDPAQRTDLIPAFMKKSGLFYLPPPCEEPVPPMDKYISHLRRCIVIEVTGGLDFGKATEAGLEFLETIETSPSPANLAQP